MNCPHDRSPGGERDWLCYLSRWPGAFCVFTFSLLTSGLLAIERTGFSHIPAAPAGQIEVGVPEFAVQGSESMGLSTAPLDMHFLPDGRLFVAAQREIAVGDGTRWETFRRVSDDQNTIGAKVAIDPDGRIYASIGGKFARIEFEGDARWQYSVAATWPASVESAGVAPGSVFASGSNWFWYGGSGALVAWHPGSEPKVIRHAGGSHRVFELGLNHYVSDAASGHLFRIDEARRQTIDISPVGTTTANGILSCADYEPGVLLVGTSGTGLRLFDGTSLRPFPALSELGQSVYINDLCSLGDRRFAAAVDNLGVIIFDHTGRILQTLDRSLDQRLFRPRKLLVGNDGVLWVLLNDGVARLKFPSQSSNFSLLVPSSLTYAFVKRLHGKLWLESDSKALRGAYSSGGRLLRFEDETPANCNLSHLGVMADRLFASDDTQIYEYTDKGWRVVQTGIGNARLGIAPPTKHGWFYAARDEVGWLQLSPEGVTARRIPVSGLGTVYNTAVDAEAVHWFELGSGRAARVFIEADGTPQIRILRTTDGLPDGWTQVFVIDGVARFNMGDRIYCYDKASDRIVEDQEFLQRYPELQGCSGRPFKDSRNRIWFVSRGAVQVLDPELPEAKRVWVAMPGFAPHEFSGEEDGVIWMPQHKSLVRYDPRIPAQKQLPPKALITAVQLPATNRFIPRPVGSLADLPFEENSLLIRFMAPADPFGAPVSFSVLMEQAGEQNEHWTSTGSVGSASFSRLKEGSYVFRVRPQAGDLLGDEARLVFSVRPPWYRTKLAISLYLVGAFCAVGLFAWLFSYMERRDKRRLARLVSERTKELNHQIAETLRKSSDLVASEERIRRLNRTLAVISGINQAIVRERNTERLFRETCRIAVEIGGFRMAWIGMVDPLTERVNPMAYAGIAEEPIETLAINLREKAGAGGQLGEILKRGEHAICSDLNTDTYSQTLRGETTPLELRSYGVFPLKLADRTMGVIALYSGGPDSFGDDEISLLDGLAMDLSFAIEHSETEKGWLQANERVRHLATFPELNPNPVLEFSADGTLAYANQAAYAMAAAAGVADLTSLFPKNTRTIVAECLAQGQPQLRLQTQYGHTTLSWSFYPIAGQGTVHCYAGNISDRLQLEARYRQAQKMDAVGQLAGGVAHDFNNLLTVILGYCSILLSKKSTRDPEEVEATQEIKEAAERAARLTRQLLTFSRRQPLHKQHLDLDNVLSNTGRMIQRLIGENIVLHMQLLPGGAWIEGDAGMIDQVLLNLAVNARDAMPNGGDLWLGLDAVTLDEIAAGHHPEARSGSFICLSVRDRGCGISEDHLAHIFEPFYTTKEVGKGTGLGLSTVQGIVEQHNGWIEVESRLGEGTTFRVYLPNMIEGGDQQKEITDIAQECGGHETILLAEDEAAVRLLAIKILESHGYRVVEAANGVEALAKWRARSGAFDLLLTDLIMPGGVSGEQLAEKLKSEKPGLKVVYMSGYPGESGGRSLNLQDGVNFLAKPFAPLRLAKTVRACLDSE